MIAQANGGCFLEQYLCQPIAIALLGDDPHKHGRTVFLHLNRREKDISSAGRE
jgi:hypothetical protein